MSEYRVAGSSSRKRSAMKAMMDGEQSTWDCSVCTFTNSPEAFKCNMCDVRKGTSTRKPKLNQLIVAQQEATRLVSQALPSHRHEGGAATDEPASPPAASAARVHGNTRSGELPRKTASGDSKDLTQHQNHHQQQHQPAEKVRKIQKSRSKIDQQQRTGGGKVSGGGNSLLLTIEPEISIEVTVDNVTVTFTEITKN